MSVKTNNKLVISFVLMICAVLLFNGCSTAPSTEGDSATETPDDGNTVTINAWVQGKAPDKYRLENIKTAAERLNEELKAEGEDIEVVIDGTIDESDWGDYKQKFTLAIESNKGPDIILSGHEDVAPWSQAGYIISLDEYIDQHNEFSDVYDNLWDSVTYKGEKWGVPQDVEARPIYYRKDYLSQLGWSDEEIESLPTKIEDGEFLLEDLLKLAAEAQDSGIVEEGYGFYHRPVQGNDFYMYYYAFGGKMQDEESGKLVLNKDALLKEYTFFHDAVFKYKTTKENFLGTDWDLWHPAVTSGESFISQAGTWTVAEWKDKWELSEEEWENFGYALVPAGEKGKEPVTLSHPLVYMISSQSEHPDLAARLLALATTPDLNTKHALESNHLAILETQEDDPDYKNDPFLSDVTYMLNYTHYLPNHDRFGTYDEAVFRGLSAVEAGQMTPDEAVETVVADLERQLSDEVIIE